MEPTAEPAGLEKPGHPDSPGIQAWRPAALQVSSLVAGLAAHALWPAQIPLVGKLGGTGTAVFVGLGIAILVFSFREFARAATSLAPSRGASALIQSGPFAYSRNPLYVAVILLILGVGVWVNSIWIWLSCAALVPVMNRAVISREESYLERRFGRVYLDYKKAVRRWL
jgi:protein-S-isoprenylcysteine O-methyltransferase Ste14